MIITVPQVSSLLPAGTPPSQPALVLNDDAAVLGAVIYNSSAVAVVYLSETTASNVLGTDGNPADGVPLQPGQSLSILPGYRGKIYAVTTAANATLRVLYGAKCN